jgi:hypothetical protein
MKTFKNWMKIKEASAVAGINPPKFPGEGSWQGAPRGFTEPLSSVGNARKQTKLPRK